jgi:hypothetical protein
MILGEKKYSIALAKIFVVVDLLLILISFIVKIPHFLNGVVVAFVFPLGYLVKWFVDDWIQSLIYLIFMIPLSPVFYGVLGFIIGSIIDKKIKVNDSTQNQ